MNLIIFLLLFFSCAQTSKKVAPLPARTGELEIKNCLRYKKEVLDLAFDSRPAFALNILEKFDLKKGFKDQKQNLISGILSKCNGERIKYFKEEYQQISACDLGFSELAFFQAGVEKIRKRQWPLEMELEAKRLALDYVSYYADEKNHSLIDRLIAISILYELSAYSVIPVEFSREIKRTLIESQSFISNLESNLKDKELTCENLNTMSEEISYSKNVGKKLSNLLKKI